MDRQAAISKARKLIALANGSTNAHEAEVAAQKLQKYLFENNIELEELTPVNENKEIVIKRVLFNGNNRDLALGQLASSISDNMFVGVYWSQLYDPGSQEYLPVLEFVGLETNVVTVIELFNTLRFAANRFSKVAFQNYKQNGGNLHGKTFNKSWFLGFVAGIRQKLQEQKREFEKMVFEVNKSKMTGMELAIVRDTQVKDYMDNLKLTKGHAPKVTDYNAFQSGKAVGLAQDVSTNIR